MKTIFHANIDGQEIVLGFGEAFGLIDPVATAVKIAPLVAAADETRQMTALHARINAVRQSAYQAAGLAEQARIKGDAPTMTRQNAEYQAKLMEIAELDKQLPAVVGAFESRRAQITVDKAAYAHPPQGEDLIDDAQAAVMKEKHAGAGEGQALLMTGEYVTDLRGRDFYLAPVGASGTWAHKVIDALGEELPAGAIMTDQLTDAQRSEIAAEAEASRVAALAIDDRENEALNLSMNARTTASQRQTEFMLDGMSQTDAFAKAKAEYEAELDTIQKKYGVAYDSMKKA